MVMGSAQLIVIYHLANAAACRQCLYTSIVFGINGSHVSNDSTAYNLSVFELDTKNNI